MNTMRQPLVLPPPSKKTFGHKLARLLSTARKTIVNNRQRCAAAFSHRKLPMHSLTLTFTPSGTYRCPGLGSTRDLVVRDLGLDPLLEQRGCSDCPVFTSCKMSHWTTVDVAITDEDALRKAVAELGCTWQIGGEAIGYVGKRLKSDFVIKVPGSAYDIAVIRKDGKLTLTTDWYRGTVAAVVGKEYGKLLQLYGIHKAHAAAKLKGYLTQRKLQPNGDIQLVINMP